MNSKIKISIVTPSYNQGAFLERTIKSVIDQKHPNIEYIIIDGGSTDNSVDIIKKYKDEVDYWVSENDSGQYDAIKKGFKKATGDVLCWINSDDILLPGSLNHISNIFENCPNIDVVYGNIYYIDKFDNIVKDMRNTPLVKSGYLYKAGFGFSQPEVFWRNSLYNKVGGIDSSGQFAMDYDLFFKFIKAGAKFKHTRVHLSALRFYEGTKTSKISHIGLK